MIIGLLIIVGTVIHCLFYNLNSTTPSYAICGIVLVVVIFLLYIRNYKNNHYGGTKFKNDFS
ncbi:MAG: hypothetical protein ACLTTH_00020 [Holdemanella porci]